MSISNIINKATGQIYDELIPQGGGVPLTKGQLISANALGKEVAVPTGANGTILSADPAQDDGLRWIAVPGATPLAQGQLLSADLAGDATIVNAPNLPAQAGWVLSADGTAGAVGTNMAWKPPTGGGGLLTANLPLFDDATTTPNTIGINFSNAVGEIPYGTATRVGALTVAPNPASSNQFLGTVAGVPTWKDVGASGTITATAPLTEYAIASASNIAIDFTSKGDLVVGGGAQVGGNPVAGVILPPASADNYVLSSFSSAPSGMRWVAPTAGGQTIVRSSSATTIVASPNSTQDTLVLCAEEPDASWSLEPDPQTGKTDPYEIEFITDAYYWEADYDPNITQRTSFIGYAVVINGARCIKLVLKKINTGTTTYTDVGHFYNSNYTLPATITSWVIPTAGALFAPIGDFVFSGCFSGFHLTAGTNIPMFNICSYQFDGETFINTPIPLRTTTAGLVGFIWSGSQPTYNEGFVYKIVSLSGFLWFFGKFNRLDINGANASQYLSIAKYNIATLELVEGLDLLNAGYGASMDATGTNPGIINDALFTPAGKLVIVGSWSWLRATNNQPFPSPATMSGFAVGDFTLNPNPWVNTPTVAGGFNYGISLATSFSLADRIIALPNTTPALPMLYTISANTLAYAGGSAPPAQLKCYLNSIVGGTTDLGFGNLPYDFILYQDVVALTTWVAFFATASGTTLQALNPSPTGVAPEYTPATLPVGVSSPYLGLSSYGLTFIVFQGKDGLYSYDPTVHANLIFTGSFYYNGILYTTATFSGTTNAHEAQSYIGTKDLKSWIQIGAKTNALTYS